MNSASTTDRPLPRAQHRAAIRARHRRAAISAAASAVVCGQRTSNCTLTTPNCHSKTNNRFNHRNQQYSIIALTNGSGAIAERYAYSAYGEPVFVSASGTVLTTSAKDNRYTYTGREWDEELSLYHFRARMYNAKSGRFYTRDPMGFVDGANTYYVSIILLTTDPLGLCAGCAADEDLVTVTKDLITSILDTELSDNVKRITTDPNTGEKRLERKTPLKDTATTGAITITFEKTKYKVECCVKKDLSGATLISSTEIPYPDNQKFGSERIAVVGGRGGWKLTQANMGAYVKFARPIPSWTISPEPETPSTLCLDASGVGSLPRNIKRDSDIEGGDKND